VRLGQHPGRRWDGQWGGRGRPTSPCRHPRWVFVLSRCCSRCVNVGRISEAPACSSESVVKASASKSRVQKKIQKKPRREVHQKKDHPLAQSHQPKMAARKRTATVAKIGTASGAREGVDSLVSRNKSSKQGDLVASKPPSRVHSAGGQQRRKRKPWSMFEETQLRRGFAEFCECWNCWALIASTYTFDESRTPSDLKDKWRVMERKRHA